MYTHDSHRRWSLALLALLAPACGLEPIEDAGGDDTIPAEVQAAFDESCATSVGCHSSGAGQVVLEAPESLAILDGTATNGEPYVVLGDLDASYLARKILGGPNITGGKMPPSPQSDDDDANTQIILDWIADGAAETGDGDGDPGDGDPGDGDGDPGSDCLIDTVPATPAFEVDIWPILEARCGTPSCHASTFGPLMPDAMTAYDNLVGAPATMAALNYVEAGSADDSYLWHKIAGTQLSVMGGGGVTMPATGELCTVEFQAIYAWITAGAMP